MCKCLIRTKSLTILILSIIFFTSCNKPESDVLKQVQSGPEKAVLDVFERINQAPLDNIRLSLVKDNQQDWYQVTAKNGQLTVTANAPTALSYGTYQYLRSIGAMAVSWEGNQISLPETFLDYQGEKVTSLFKQRAYLNVCAYGYTMPWWDWDTWQNELDWMAVHGVNNPVAMEGQEYIWQKLWNEFGVSNQELQHYFSGPAFTPWQRMGNIEGHEGPLPQSWINKKHQLQKQIVARMESLGMQPVVPAFGGYVPKKFIDLFPEAKISPMPKWTGFSQETYWLDPADPLFPKIAKRFIELYNQEYGAQKYYLSDSFNEMLPPVSQDNRYADLAQYGQSIYESIQQAAPGATWVMQGWMFGADEEFWDLESIEAFLSKVPADKVMIHDIGNDRYHVWQRAQGFFEKPWIFGFIHNYGGSDPVYGALDFYQQQVKDVLDSKTAGKVTGFGVFPEGIRNNSVAYEYMFDLPWKAKNIETSAWLEQYTSARYAVQSPQINQAWSLLNDAVYSTPYWKSRWWEGSAGAYLLFKRPTYELQRFESHPSDLAKLDQAIELLVAASEKHTASPLLIYDLVDFTKHSITLHVDNALQQAMAAYQKGDISFGDKLSVTINQLVKSLDRLMGLHQESLSTWLTDAADYADTPEDRTRYIDNAKQQITIWGGPKLKDYASKAWQGMYAGFYLPRWNMYLSALKKSAETGEAFDEKSIQAQLIEWENTWVADQQIAPLHIPSQPLEQIKILLKNTKKLSTQ